jgi:hypothetical protein
LIGLALQQKYDLTSPLSSACPDIFLEIGHFTLDNAANNKTMMAALERMLDKQDIDFKATDCQVMCFAHIINLCSGRVLRAAGDVDGEASELNALGLARGAIRVIRVSGKRRDAFTDVVRHGNAKGWFKSGTPPKIVLVKELELLRDVRSRWDSVYFMVNRLREMRPVQFSFPYMTNVIDVQTGCPPLSRVSAEQRAGKVYIIR